MVKGSKSAKAKGFGAVGNGSGNGNGSSGSSSRSLEVMTVNEMKVVLKQMGLPVSGNRQRLQDRLRTAGYNA